MFVFFNVCDCVHIVSFVICEFCVVFCFESVGACMGGFCNVWVRVSVIFVMCGFV